MDKKALYSLLQRYLNQTCTEEEKIMVDKWLELLQDDKEFYTYSTTNLKEIQSRIWEKIQADIHPVQNEPRQPFIFRRSFLIGFSKLSVAAAVICAIVFGALRFSETRSTPHAFDFEAIIPKNEMITNTNTTDKSLKIILEDRTVVVLEPGTTLKYPTHFKANQREAYLQGKAFFDVSKNSSRPFFIYHNNLVTHVIGTSFIINTHKSNRQVEVSVISGKVEVSENGKVVQQEKKKENGVVLTPNQRVIYTEDTRVFVASVAENPMPLDVKAPESFSFQNEGLNNVLTAMSKEYGIDIVVENENINKCNFTGNITRLDLYSKLDVICKSISSTYEIKGTRILIKGTGCE